MYNRLDLSTECIKYEVVQQILIDNGLQNLGEKDGLQRWETTDRTKYVSLMPDEDCIPADFLLYALKKVGISQSQIAMYNNIVYNQGS